MGIKMREAKVSTHQRLLCDVLDSIGADGSSEAVANKPIEDLMKMIVDHVQWLEDRALHHGLGQRGTM